MPKKYVDAIVLRLEQVSRQLINVPGKENAV
jgi:hypothetical protein